MNIIINAVFFIISLALFLVATFSDWEVKTQIAFGVWVLCCHTAIWGNAVAHQVKKYGGKL